MTFPLDGEVNPQGALVENSSRPLLKVMLFLCLSGLFADDGLLSAIKVLLAWWRSIFAGDSVRGLSIVVIVV